MAASAQRKILFVPNSAPGMGTGHLQRCLHLAAELRAKGWATQFLSWPPGKGSLSSLDNAHPLDLLPTLESAEKPDLIVLDNRCTSLGQLQSLWGAAPLLGLDEGGAARRYLPFLIDTLPVYRQTAAPNQFCLYRPAEQPVPHKINFPYKRILLSFGGEDRAGLSGRLLQVLLKQRICKPGDITLIEGGRFLQHSWPAEVHVIKAPASLTACLAQADLLFTHFGLTALEAVQAGVPVVLFNPTSYHRRLSRACGLPEVGVKRVRLSRLRRYLADGALAIRQKEVSIELDPARTAALPELIDTICVSGNLHCPVCNRRESAAPDPAVARFAGRTIFRCAHCGLLYLCHFFPGALSSYSEKYFFEQYAAQYGRTYLEDFEHLKKLAAARLRICARLLGGLDHKDCLDIGCAYGPFLEACAEAGGNPQGMDLSRAAVTYLKRQGRFPVFCADFAGPGLPPPLQGAQFDLLSFWYVIEHFRDLGLVLRRANRLLRTGGLLALSTPSARGISARKDFIAFLKQSPADHFTLLSPAVCRKILKREGFKVVKLRSTGHHPERFPGPCGKSDSKILRQAVLLLSRLGRLGDTFEVYARKVKDCES